MRYDRQTATTWLHYGRFSPVERLPYHRRLFSASSLFSLPLGLPPPRHAVPPTTNLPGSSICNVREPARRATLASSDRPTWNGRFFLTLYISANAPRANSRRDIAEVLHAAPDTSTDIITSKYLGVARYISSRNAELRVSFETSTAEYYRKVLQFIAGG